MAGVTSGRNRGVGARWASPIAKAPMRKYPAPGRALFIFCPDFASLNKDGAFLRATSGGQLSRFSPMIFSKMARHLLLRVSRIPLLAVAMAGTVVLSAPLSLGAQENDKDLSVLGPGREEAAAPNPFEVAQGYGRPPGDIGDPGDVPYGGEPPDGGQLLVRIGRLESQIREINGQIEQMQFETRKLEEQLRKFQEDVDFRFREGGPGAPAAKPPQKRSESTEIPAPAEAQLAAPGAAVPPPRASGRGDAFDPSQNPTAPGVPRPLGSRAAAAASNPGGARRDESTSPGFDQNDPGAPLDLSNGRSRRERRPRQRPR